jgi:hypothetical protein
MHADGSDSLRILPDFLDMLELYGVGVHYSAGAPTPCVQRKESAAERPHSRAFVLRHITQHCHFMCGMGTTFYGLQITPRIVT